MVKGHEWNDRAKFCSVSEEDPNSQSEIKSVWGGGGVRQFDFHVICHAKRDRRVWSKLGFAKRVCLLETK